MRKIPPITSLAVAACVVLFAVNAPRVGQPAGQILGYLSADRVWDGGYWSLFSSVFVHLELWHLIFNVYWLWILGRLVEGVLGAPRYLLFLTGAAFTSSAIQLAVSDQTGIGASGVGYALFGLVWLGGRWVPPFAQALGKRTVQVLLIWLVGCFVATWAQIITIGNGAHVAGLVFGLMAAGAVAGAGQPRWRALSLAGLGLMIALSAVPLAWCPWSWVWTGQRAAKAYERRDFEGALRGYRRSLALGADRVWVLQNMALIHYARGARPEYRETVDELAAVDPRAVGVLEEWIRRAANGTGGTGGANP